MGGPILVRHSQTDSPPMSYVILSVSITDNTNCEKALVLLIFQIGYKNDCKSQAGGGI